MLKNNNQAVIRKMAVRSIRSNRKKNSLYLVAIVLAVLMLFTVMQTGASYMHMQYVWRLHSVGELYDGILMGGVTKEQEETVKADPGIEVVGITEFMLGNIGEKNISIIYEDKNYREKMHQPGILHQEGRYPETAGDGYKDAVGKAEVGKSYNWRYAAFKLSEERWNPGRKAYENYGHHR